MIKKFIAIIAAIAMCLPLTAYAADSYFVVHGDQMTVYWPTAEDGTVPEHLILSGYDENGKLVETQTAEKDENGKLVETQLVEKTDYSGLLFENRAYFWYMDGAVRYKLCCVNSDGSSYFLPLEGSSAGGLGVDQTPPPTVTRPPRSTTAPTASEAPAVTAAPAVTDAPAATKAPKTSETPEASYPPYVVPPPGPPYERSLDAYHTFSVIKSVSSADSDNGPVYLVDVLRQGKEEQLTVPTDARIVVSSDYYSDMTGADASALEEGDIVYFDRNNAGTKITGMAFIYRPAKGVIMTSQENYGTDFEHLFSTRGRVYGSPANEPGTVIRYGQKSSGGRYQYAFGAVLEKGPGYFSLINRDGVTDNAIEISVTNDTIVYICDMSLRHDKLDISNQSAIIKSAIPKSAADENEKITFADDYDYTYAYARVINGEATEVVIYTGYDE